MSTPANPAAWKPLDAPQRRVLGVLIEKAKTTPAAYPMTVNAIVTGCNQKNNRDPITELDDFDVEKALGELGEIGAASEIDWLGRVPKYKHHAYDWLGVSRLELAVMAELLLRGAQAMGELRARAARMEPIADLAALKPVLDALIARGLVREITSPGRGQVVDHALYDAADTPRHAARSPGDEPSTPDRAARDIPQSAPAGVPPPGGTAVSLAGLSASIAELRAEVARLEERIAGLEARYS